MNRVVRQHSINKSAHRAPVVSVAKEPLRRTGRDMRIRRSFLGAVATAGLLSSALAVAGTPSAAQAADNCTTTGAKTIKTAFTRPRGIELRANTPPNRNLQCAWGRIVNGSPGDRVWVDRSWDDKNTWEQLS